MPDVAVIGGGPAGIAAASTAAEHGLDVVLIDEAPRPGGQIWRHVTRQTLPLAARNWMHRLGGSKARVVSSTSVIDITRDAEGFTILTANVNESVRSRMIQARNIIICTGARELFIPFPGWTLPGVVGAGGGQALLKAGARMSGKRIVVAGSGPLLLPVAAMLAQAGAHVSHVLEQAPAARVAAFGVSLIRTPRRIMQAAVYRARSISAQYMYSAWVREAVGDKTLRHVIIQNGAETTRVKCDILCTGYGLVPSLEIAQLLGCAVSDGRVTTTLDQRTSVDNVYAAGESTGVKGVDAALLEGQIAGSAVAKQAREPLVRAAAGARAFAERMDIAFRLRPELRTLANADTIVCRCEDVTLGAITRCNSMREAKLHTRAGMGPCQGRVCGPAIEMLTGWNETSVRPPIVSAPISAYLSDGVQ